METREIKCKDCEKVLGECTQEEGFPEEKWENSLDNYLCKECQEARAQALLEKTVEEVTLEEKVADLTKVVEQINEKVNIE